jgi:hypothetical protein
MYLPWIPVLEAGPDLLVVADLLVNAIGHVNIATIEGQ